MKWLKRLLVWGGVGVIIAAGWLSYYDARDWAPVFTASKGFLMSAPVVDTLDRPKVNIADVELSNDKELRVKCRVSIPKADGRWPAAVVVAGMETGIKIIDLLPPQTNLVVLAIDYPGQTKFDFSGLVPAVKSLRELRQTMMQTVAAVLLASEWLQRTPVVSKDRVSLLGVSAGCLVAPAAMVADERFSRLVLVQGGAGVGQIAAANTQRLKLPMSPATAATVAEWLFKPLEPRRYAARITPRSLMMVNAKDDAWMPAQAAQELYDRAAEPKRLLWLEGAQVAADDNALNREITLRVLAELGGAPVLLTEPKKQDTKGR